MKQGRSGPTRRAGKTAAQKSPRTRGKGRSDFKTLCRSLPHTTEDIKWGDDLVFSVGGKMYAAFDIDDEEQFGFKCDDADYERLTGQDRDGAEAKGARGRGKGVEGIIPAPYAARFGWVKVLRRDALPEGEIRMLLVKAHAIVFAGLPASVRKRLMGGDPPAAAP